MDNGWDPIITSFLRFHVAFTIRRILFELGAAFPWDNAWSKTDNQWNKKAWLKLKNEFDIEKR